MDYWPRIHKLISDWNTLYQRVQALQKQVDQILRDQAKIWGS
jgi:hypothetical protein